MSKKKEDSQPENREESMDQMMQAQMLEQQFKQLQKYLEQFDEQLAAINSLVDALGEFSKLKKGEKMLSPIANGIFVQSHLDDASEIMINVGNGVVVKKTVPECIKLLDAQKEDVNTMRSEVLKQLEELMAKLESVDN